MGRLDLERLRFLVARFSRYGVEGADVLELAAKEVERLQAENERLSEALTLETRINVEMTKQRDQQRAYADAAVEVDDRRREEIASVRAEVDRLKRGDFTAEELGNLCHNLHERPGGCTREEFVRGCLEYQRKLFGAPALEKREEPT